LSPIGKVRRTDRVAAQGRQDHDHEADRPVRSEANTPKFTLMVLLVDERPEGHRHSAQRQGRVIFLDVSTVPQKTHPTSPNCASKRAKRLVEQGRDV